MCHNNNNNRTNLPASIKQLDTMQERTMHSQKITDSPSTCYGLRASSLRQQRMKSLFRVLNSVRFHVSLCIFLHVCDQLNKCIFFSVFLFFKSDTLLSMLPLKLSAAVDLLCERRQINDGIKRYIYDLANQGQRDRSRDKTKIFPFSTLMFSPWFTFFSLQRNHPTRSCLSGDTFKSAAMKSPVL